MKPLHSPRKKDRALSVARAKMFIKANLGWMDGIPSGEDQGERTLTWTTLRGERVVVSRESLSQAKRTLHELQREPAILNAAVDDAPAWVRAVERVLEVLNAPIHRGHAIPDAIGPRPSRLGRSCTVDAVLGPLVPPRVLRRAIALREGEPRLTRLLDSLGWAFALDARRFARALQIVERAPRQFARLDDRLLGVILISLVLDEGEDKCDPLLALVFDERGARVPTVGRAHVDARIEAIRVAKGGKPKPVAPPEPTLPEWLGRLAMWLHARDSGTRRRALALLSRLDVPRELGAWDTWWSSLPSTRVQTDWTEARRAAPRELTGRALYQCVTETAAREPTFVQSLLDLLDAIAVHHPALGGFFVDYWRAVATTTSDRSAALAIAESRELLRRTSAVRPARLDSLGVASGAPARLDSLGVASGAPAQLAPWATALDAWRREKHFWPFENEVVGRGTSRASTRRFYDALTACILQAAPEPLDEKVVNWLEELARLDLPVTLLSSVARLAPSGRTYVSAEAFERIIRMSEGDVSAIERSLGSTSALEMPELERALDVLSGLVTAGQTKLAQSLLAHGFGPRLAAAGEALHSLKLPSPLDGFRTASEAATWTTQYPAALHASLMLLEAAYAREPARARAIAERLLSDNFPERSALDTELAHAEAKLTSLSGAARDRLATRIVNLRQRRSLPATVSAHRLERLRGKLDHAVRVAVVAAVERAAEAGVLTFVRDLLGTDVLPGEFLAPVYRPYFWALARLTPAMRALAVRILRARTGPPPWDLRDAPENRAFLARMVARGIAIEPWLDGTTVTTFRAPDGTEVSVRLEDDPLEVMQMGAHFETCLSPGSFNYFSVFANIADVNKRVAYGRNAKGGVVARVLLALTAQGGLLTFNPYSHASIAWDQIVKRFASGLASRMNTVVVPAGAIARLVAPDWYDDGARDLTGRFRFLESHETFPDLETMDAASFFETLEEKLAPVGLNELTLPFVMGIPGLAKNVSVVGDLLERLAKSAGSLTPQSLVTACQLALDTKMPERIADDVLDHIEAWCVRTHVQHGWVFPPALAVTVALDPRRGLELLRKTRAKGVRRWAEETDAERLELAALAHEGLARPAQALALYRLGANAEGSRDARQRCATRVRAAERDQKHSGRQRLRPSGSNQ